MYGPMTCLVSSYVDPWKNNLARSSLSRCRIGKMWWMLPIKDSFSRKRNGARFPESYPVSPLDIGICSVKVRVVGFEARGAVGGKLE